MLGQDSRVHVTTLPLKIFNGLCGTRTGVQFRPVTEEQHSDVLIFKYIGQSSPLSLLDKKFKNAATLQFVTKCCCSSRFLFFIPSHRLSNCPHIDSTFTIRSGQVFVKANRLLTFSKHSRSDCCFNGTSVSAILGSTVVLPSVRRNSYDSEYD